MRWPRDGKPCAPVDIQDRVESLWRLTMRPVAPETEPPPMPWETRLGVWWFGFKRRLRRKPRRRGTPVA